MSNIFNPSNVLKNLIVKVSDVEIEDEYITSIEIVYKNSTPEINGDLIIKDVTDLNLIVDWYTSVIEIDYTDIFDENVNKKFRVLNIQETQDNNLKSLVISLQDEFSYTLKNSFKQMSFTTNIIDAIDTYISELGLEVETEFSACELAVNFVVPNNVNNLDFFISELAKYGYLMGQTKTGITIKSVADLSPSSLPDEDEPFVDVTANQLYYNRIIQHEITHTDRNNTPDIVRGVAFNPLIKKMEYSVSEDINTNIPFSINDNTKNLQDSTDIKDVYINHLSFDGLSLKMYKMFMKQNEVTVVVNGYIKNDIDKIFNLKLKGNRITPETQAAGNIIIGGKWASTQVIDKMIGGAMIQKIKLNRADSSNKL